CPAVQLWHPLWIGLLQASEEQVGEEMVVAVPVALLVERHQEQVGSFQGVQHLLAIAAAGEHIAKWAAESLENRGLEQEASHLVRLLLEHLLGQVVKDV